MTSGIRNGNVRTRHVSRIAPLPARSSDVRLTLPARAENVAVVRHVIGAFADALNLPRDIVEDIRLALTEACTNVVRHAYDGTEPGTLDVVIRPEGEVVEIIVSDYGRGMNASPDRTGPGLGIQLIAALAHRLVIEHAPQAGSRLAMSFARRPPVGVR
jgi:anti-sigma regulatory factor (Ser/Thr protein kinase)